MRPPQGLRVNSWRSQDEIKGVAWLLTEAPETGCDLPGASTVQETDGRVPQAGHLERGSAAVDQARILPEGHILDPVQPIRDPPMPALEGQKRGRCADVRPQTGDAVLHLPLAQAMFLPGAFQPEDLCQAWPLNVARQVGRGNQLADLLLTSVATFDGAHVASIKQRQRWLGIGHRIEQPVEITLSERLVTLDQPQIVAASI